MTQPVPGTLSWYKLLAEEIVHPGFNVTVNSESSMSTVLLVLLKRSRMANRSHREYTFVLPYPNFEGSRVVNIRFNRLGLGGVINGLPLSKCIGWFNCIKLYLILSKY